MDGVLINQLTTLMLIVSYLVVTLTYRYLMNTAPSEKARTIFRYLIYAWVLFTLTYVLLFVRNMSSDATFNIIINKVDTAITAFGAIFLFFFMGELYESRTMRNIIVSIGVCVGAVATAVYLAWGGFYVESTEFGIEVIPPPFVGIVVLICIVVIISTFLFTSTYIGLRAVNPELRRRIVLVGVTYSVWWVFQLFEAGGFLIHLLGPLGMIINRIILAVLAFVLIIIWAGKHRFVEAIRSIFAGRMGVVGANRG